MKIRSILMALAVFTTGGSVWSQGTIQFCNSTPGVYAPVLDWWTKELLAPDPNLVVALYMGNGVSSLQPVASTRFTSPGIFGEGKPAVTVAEYAPGDRVFFEVRVWDSQGGKFPSYESAVSWAYHVRTGVAGEVTLGDASSPLGAPELIGLRSFVFPVLIPEPSSWAMLGLGLGVLGFQYRSRR